MNKTILKSLSMKATVLATAVLAFSSCSKTAFTEQEAYDLEKKRLDDIAAREQAARTLQRTWDVNSAARQRALDSLDRLNAGGRVFYTVSVVSASNSVVGGRTEGNTLAGLKITATQYGAAQVRAVDVDPTGTNNVATFEMRSGEATISISANNHTTVDYVVNLTPGFSGITNVNNGSIVYVGNVVPLFEVPATAAPAATGDPLADGKFAVVRGRVWIETDLTNGTNEIVPAGTGITAAIDPSTTSFGRYIDRIAGQAASTTQGGNSQATTALGTMQRFVYSNPANVNSRGVVTRVTTNANGDYAMLVPATSQGLSLRLGADRLFADRTYFDNNGVLRTGVRHIYGPGVAQDGVPQNTGLPRFTWGIRTPANITAAYTRGGFTGEVASAAVTGNTTTNGGSVYLTAPTVTVSSGAATINTSLVQFRDNDDATTTTVNENIRAYRGSNLRGLSVSVGNRGTGYTPRNDDANTNGPTTTLTRTDVVEVGTGTLDGANAAAGLSVSFVQVTDGGFGFINPAGLPTAAANAFTGFLPVVRFVDPTTNQDFIPSIATPAAAVVRTDALLGTIARIDVTGFGGGYPRTPNVVFDYGQATSVPGVDGGGDDLFVSNGTDKGLRFNAAGYSQTFLAGITQSDLTFTAGAFGSGYVFTPNVVLSPNAQGVAELVAAPTRAMRFAATIGGTTAANHIARIAITDQGAGVYVNPSTTADTDVFSATANVGLSITPNNRSNTLAARAFSSGTGLTNYKISNNNINTITGAASWPSGLSNPLGNSTASASAYPTGTLSANEFDNLILASDALVVFGPPQIAPMTFAYGVPVFRRDGTANNSQILDGVRILSGGAGYTQSARMFLIPNPFRGEANTTVGNAPVGDTTPASGRNQALKGSGNGIPANNDILTLLNSSYTNGVSTALRSTPNTIRFTVVSGGKYATVPTINLVDGGRTLAEQPAVGGITFADGVITAISDITSGVPDYSSNPTVIVTDALVNGLNAAFSTANATDSNLGLEIGQGGALVPFGTPLGATVTYPAMLRDFSGTLATAVNANQVSYFNITDYINVTVSAPASGTTATVRPIVNPATRAIRAFELTTAGSGYSRGNFFQTFGTATAVDGQPFTVFGFANSSNANGQVATFDAFQGTVYATDIHYGTGRRID